MSYKFPDSPITSTLVAESWWILHIINVGGGELWNDLTAKLSYFVLLEFYMNSGYTSSKSFVVEFAEL